MSENWRRRAFCEECYEGRTINDVRRIGQPPTQIPSHYVSATFVECTHERKLVMSDLNIAVIKGKPYDSGS